MTLPVPTSEAQYGYVVGRVIRALADSVDADNKPDIKAATGSVTFLPKARLGRTSDYSAFVVREPIICPLDWQGFVTSQGAQYVVLTVGVYDVSFKLEAGTAIPSFAVEVTAAHTQATPLDLVTAAPYSPPAGAVVQTMLVPADAAVGQVLSWTASGLGWVDANSLSIGTVTTGPAGSLASASITGTAPEQTLNLTIPRGDKGDPDTTTWAGITDNGDGTLTLAGTAITDNLDGTLTIGA